MWPFSYKAKPSVDVPEDIRERVKSLESDLKLLRAEWNDVYDKIVHQFDRDRKRKAKLLEDPQNGSEIPSSMNWSDPVQIMAEARRKGL